MKKYSILLATIFLLFAGSSCATRCGNCEKSYDPETNSMLQAVMNTNSTYPADFYVNTSPLAASLATVDCGCANSVSEADAYFDYTNTQNARNYTPLSETETAKYYERVWTASPGTFIERLHKCAYLNMDCISGAMYMASTPTADSVKEFAEYWFFNGTSIAWEIKNDTVFHIISSNVVEYSDHFESTVRFVYYQKPSTNTCEGAVEVTGTILILKSDNSITGFSYGYGPGKMYYSGKGRFCMPI